MVTPLASAVMDHQVLELPVIILELVIAGPGAPHLESTFWIINVQEICF